MTEIFEEREKSYEAKYKLDEEQRFKAHSRRNKLAGLWAAAKLGLVGAAAADYARQVVTAEMDTPVPNAVAAKLLRDLQAKGIAVTPAEIKRELDRLLPIAYEQILAEYPMALDSDHAPVGG